ncbi:valine--tRNA ligase [Candidatus Microgenomates bacterium]|jgi:valyl-tRNA synthetase|nr:MAG: valine--tRNA ligase [Candidatus Microgenomates bacterium]
MEPVYEPLKHEQKIYELWEKGGFFTGKIDKEKKPFSVILPLPNANDPMHMGHALFTIQDILCRYHRMLGDSVLWLPGSDHAGIETQFVFEKKLSKEGKSRFDFDRNTLFKMIWDFVEENREINIEQMKKLGFSLDWTRYHYSLEPEILKQIFDTFRKLHKEGLVYRGERLVNYCTFCGTAFSDLEVDHVERDDFLYYLDYGSLQIATTRPETIFADVAVAVNPEDKKYENLIGKKAIVPLINKEIPIIADSAVEKGFGTGALKITPAHDPVDFEIGKRHNLPVFSVIDLNGKMINVPNEIEGLYPKQARNKTTELLEKEGKLLKKEPLRHTVGICYRCKNLIEPLLMPQWFVKTKPLAAEAIEAVKKGKTKIFPPRFKKVYLDWMENIIDWNISRQIIWGPQIPAWYCLDCNQEIKINFLDKNGKLVSGIYKNLKENYPFEEIKNGLQSLTAPVEASYVTEENKSCPSCQGSRLLQETDTFDTWFLSGQWPLTTLGFNVKDPEKSAPDFKYFYPTSVMDTLWDILFFWVGRMMMFGLYLAEEVPFKLVHIHARVVDKFGQKMSKSKGNVVDPILMTEKYGADALRMSLVYGIAPASDIVVSEEKIKAMRNFANKVWNIGRFIKGSIDESGLSDKEKIPSFSKDMAGLSKEDREIVKDLEETIKKVTDLIEKYHFGLAAETIYEFIWHRFADQYIEYSKERVKNKDLAVFSVLRHVYLSSLKLLHPFMPFITESLWQIFSEDKESLTVSSWPKVQ